MKTLSILGIAFAVISQANAGTVRNAYNEQDGYFKSDSLVNEQTHFAPVDDQVFINPSTIFYANNPRSIEEVIAEDNKITENTPVNNGDLLYIEKAVEEVIADDNKIIEASPAEIRPLYIERTIEDKIFEDNTIIEGILDAPQPLDFETINKKQMIFKKADSNLLIGMN